MMPALAAAAGAVVVAFAGGVLLGEWDGGDRARAACEQRALEFTVAQADAQVAALAAARAKADTLAARLAAAETRTRTVYKEIVRELPAATLGRPCLGDDALGLLDRFAGLAPLDPLPAAAGQPADSGGSVATDTQIAGWIAAAWEQHERERQRCNALIDWHRGEE